MFSLNYKKPQSDRFWWAAYYLYIRYGLRVLYIFWLYKKNLHMVGHILRLDKVFAANLNALPVGAGYNLCIGYLLNLYTGEPLLWSCVSHKIMIYPLLHSGHFRIDRPFISIQTVGATPRPTQL